MSADADRIACLGENCRCFERAGHGPGIAQLTAELAEVRRGFEDEVERQGRRADQAEAAHERTKAELAEARTNGERFRQSMYALETRVGEVKRERDAAQAEAAAMRDWCAAWLIRARLAVYREGWEEGMSVSETTEALSAVLANIGCDDGTEQPDDIAETKRLLAMPITYKPPAGRAHAARVPLLEATLAAFARSGLHACWKCGLIMKSVSKALREKCSECGAALAALGEKGPT